MGLTLGDTLTLASAGAEAEAEVVAPPKGWEYISEVVSTDASTVDFFDAFTTDYDKYMITAINVGSDTTNIEVFASLQFSDGSISQYGYRNKLVPNSTSTFNYSGGGQILSNMNNTGSISQRTNFTIEIYNPLSTNAKIAVATGCSYSGFANISVNQIFTTLLSTSTADQTGFRFSTSSGTLTGTFKLYGLAKS